MDKVSPKKPKPKFNLDLALKIFLIIAVLASGVKLFLMQGNSARTSGYSVTAPRDEFAKCLNDKGLIMYGSDTCPYCQSQKEMFGSSFEKINYVNCDFDKQICSQKQITAYPVWQINDKLFPGIETFDQLANATGCVAPKINQ